MTVSVPMGGCVSADQPRRALRQKPVETDAEPLIFWVDHRASDDRWALQGGKW